MQRVVAKVARETAFYAGSHSSSFWPTFPFYWMVITAFKTQQRSLQRHQYPLLVQRSADARAFPLSVRGDAVHALAVELADHRRLRRRDHARHRAAGRL